MVKRLFDFLHFGRKRPDARRGGAAPRRPQEAAGPDLPEAASGFSRNADSEPAAAVPGAPSEPPAAGASPADGSGQAAEVRSVRESVDRLKQRALTVRELRETIERTIEARVSEIRGVVEGIQELLREQGRRSWNSGEADQRFLGDAVQRIGEREHAFAAGAATEAALTAMREALAALERRVWELGRELPRTVKELLGDAPAVLDKLGEELALRDARVLAWCERISVRAHAASKEAETAAAERAAIRALLDDLREGRIRAQALRKRLHYVREALAAGMAELRDGVARNMVSRALLARRVEAALRPFERAIHEIGELIKDIEA